MAGPQAPGARRDGTERRVERLVANHGNTLLGVARKVSLCSDDAYDALQRALEIYLRRVDTLDSATEVAWMRVVVRNEALAVRKARSQLVHGEEADLDAHAADDQRSLQERVESAERVTRSTEALRELKPDEARALLLKAEGLSYNEIAERFNWTYTKVNRCITEGRARFRKAFRGIESGEQCESVLPLLLALAKGAADADALVRLKPHLRHCSSCRAEVRRLHRAHRPGLAAWLPLPGLLDRLRPSAIKAELYGLFSRVSGSEPLTGALAGSGGGRSASATALVGLCLAGAGAGGYCALGGPLPDVSALANAEPRAGARAHPATTSTPVATPVATVVAVPTATPAAAPAVSSRRPRRDAQSARTREPASSEFSFEAAPTATPVAANASPSPALVVTSTPGRTPEPATSEAEGEFGFER